MTPFLREVPLDGRTQAIENAKALVQDYGGIFIVYEASDGNYFARDAMKSQAPAPEEQVIEIGRVTLDPRGQPVFGVLQ